MNKESYAIYGHGECSGVARVHESMVRDLMEKLERAGIDGFKYEVVSPEEAKVIREETERRLKRSYN